MFTLRSLVMLVTIGACGSSESTPDATAPLDLPMNIIVLDDRIEVYMDAADRGSCLCTATRFPAPGRCSFLTDAGPCSGNPYCPSCITDVGVELDGQRLTPTIRGDTDPWTLYYDPFAAGQLSVVLEGCGHPQTRIPVDGIPFPQTTVTAEYVNGRPHAAWTSDAMVVSTMVTIYGPIAPDLCHVQNVSDYTSETLMYARSVRVSPFVSRTELDTEFGHATIWRGGNGFAMFPPSP